MLLQLASVAVAVAEELAQAPLGSLDLTCLYGVNIRTNPSLYLEVIPSRALNAGSTLPPLARRTALTTAASMDGKASLRVFSACCSGFKGRGGFGGATSSPEPGRDAETGMLEDALRGGGEDDVS